MKKMLILLVVALLFAATPAFSAPAGAKGASPKAFEHASDEAIFHRVGDWFATVGKTDTEKKAIIAERKAKRTVLRAQKKLEKQKRLAEKKANKAQKKAGKQMKGLKKGVSR